MSGSGIGIDLGTYNSCAAYATGNGQVQTVKSQYGPTPQGMVFPSFLRFDELGNPVAYGEEARAQMAIAPGLVVWGAKRLIGRPFRQAQGELWRFAYSIQAGPDGRVLIPVGQRQYTPAEISTLILKWVKRSAETVNPFIVAPVRRAIVTHPAYFDTVQTEETKKAAQDAGFDEVGLVAEPVAAARAYGVGLDASAEQFIMAIDWGAGTLDIATVLLRLGKGGEPVVSEIRPARGDVALGGVDMDDLLLLKALEVNRGLASLQPLVQPSSSPRPAAADLGGMFGVGLSPEARRLLQEMMTGLSSGQARLPGDRELWGDLCRLRSAVEQAKIALSRVPATKENTTCRGAFVQIKMARSRRDCLDRERDWIILEEVLQPVLQKFRAQIEFAVRESDLSARQFHHVLLIGGPMHMRCVQRVVREVFASNRQVVHELDLIERTGFPVDPMQAVAWGAALYARRVEAPPPQRIARSYGVLLGGGQGELLIKDGDHTPCNAALPGVLSHRGRPGMPILVGLYLQEKQPGMERYVRMGGYEFVPTLGRDGMSAFQPALHADRDGIVSLTVKDALSGAELRLERLSVLDGHEIPRPSPLAAPAGSEPPSDQPPSPPPHSDRVPAAMVQQKRHAGQSAMQIADAKHDHPRIQGDNRAGQALASKIGALRQALAALPASGDADQRSYQQVAHAITELRNFLDTHQLLEPHERFLLQ